MENDNQCVKQIENQKVVKNVSLLITMSVNIGKSKVPTRYFNSEYDAVNYLMDVYAKRMIEKEEVNSSKDWIFSKHCLIKFEDTLE